MAINFNASEWLSDLAQIGGGYALMAGRKLCFMVSACDGHAVEAIMSRIVGHPERQEQVKLAIEQRQCGEA